MYMFRFSTITGPLKSNYSRQTSEEPKNDLPYNSAQSNIYRSYHIQNKMKITCWYKNGSLDAFRQFCIQNQDKPISVKLTNRSEPVMGALYNHCLNSPKAAGLFILLTDRVIHPAYYGLDCVESLHIDPQRRCLGKQ